MQITIQFSLGILAEAALAYVGLGAQPPTPSWGKMLADSQTMMVLAPHLAVIPGLCIVFTVMGLNLLGDGLRDIFDPRLRRAQVSLLRIKDLKLDIGPFPILRDIDLEVDRGQTLGIIGESGSGKSMTALAVMGLLPRSAVPSGSIELDGEDLLAKSEEEMCGIRGKDIGMIFQEPMTALDPLKSIGAQVAETVLVHRGGSRREAWQEADRALARAGLPADLFPRERFRMSCPAGSDSVW